MPSHGFYQENKNRLKEEHREYYKNNKEAELLRVRRWRGDLKFEVLFHYSGGVLKCANCGFSDIRALCLDHLDGGGDAERKGVRTGWNYFRELKKRGFPKGYQVLCANCNLIKAIENRELG